MSGFSKTIDDIMEPLGYERREPIKSTDFGPLPESEWTDEEREAGQRRCCRVNPDDPTRLDVFIQFKPIQYISIEVDLSF